MKCRTAFRFAASVTTGTTLIGFGIGLVGYGVYSIAKLYFDPIPDFGAAMIGTVLCATGPISAFFGHAIVEDISAYRTSHRTSPVRNITINL